jgi:WD40 repeat protein
MSDRLHDEKLTAGLKLRYTLPHNEAGINRLAWSPDGRMLASGSPDHTVQIWDTEAAELRCTLRGHDKVVSSVAWSPDGQRLVSGSDDETIRLWDWANERTLLKFKGHTQNVTSVAWSPDGEALASTSDDATVCLWDVGTGLERKRLRGHTGPVLSVAWSPDGQALASGSFDSTVRLWDSATGELRHFLRQHSGKVYSVAWSPDGRMLASGSDDRTIGLWDTLEQRVMILEGHTSAVSCVSFSSDGGLLASRSFDDTIRLWQCNTWNTVAMWAESGRWPYSALAFHPQGSVLATLGDYDKVIHIWDLDLATLLNDSSPTEAVQYTNAKVVLLGDTGVGKSGLGLVLIGKPFSPTMSTHGRCIWKFCSQDVELAHGRKETHEMFLWDMAGQSGYRLVHQLYLDQVAVALVVFDARSESAPFTGVHHWARALRQVQRIHGDTAPPIKRFLVAARLDVGRIGVGRSGIEDLMRQQGFDEYFETSAKEGWDIERLVAAIRGAIDWESLPKVSSTALFQRIKMFLLNEKGAGRRLSTVDDLYLDFMRSGQAPAEHEELRAQFETCIGLVERQGLIQGLNFGNLVLLQPELRDAYAAAIVLAAQDEREGRGCIAEADAREGRFRMPEDVRLANKEQEKLLLIATIEDLLRHEVALREHAKGGPYLILPSQFSRKHPQAPDPEGKGVVFTFEGPVLNIYATLAVRLSHSRLFKNDQMWKNAATYGAQSGGVCGVSLREVEEGQGELTLFFTSEVNEETRVQFGAYVFLHLQRWALPESIHVRRVFTCSNSECRTPVSDSQVKGRRKLGFDWIKCPVCESRIDFELELKRRREAVDRAIATYAKDMDRAADTQRDRDIADSVVQGKRETSDFDTFLCHNSEDKPAVKEIGIRLRNQGILPWLDEWELQPGLSWQRLLEEQIKQIKSAAVFVGTAGLGPWQREELEAFLLEFVRRGCPVIPVVLAGAPQKPELPVFLKSRTWVDFRKQDPDPMKQLLWGITGERS